MDTFLPLLAATLWVLPGMIVASFVIYRLYAASKAEALHHLLDERMTPIQKINLLVSLTQSSTFLLLFLSLLLGWPYFVWKSWGVKIVEHLRYHWARFCIQHCPHYHHH